MNILQLIYESEGSPFGFGGAGVRAYEIYRRLQERHSVDLAVMRFPGAPQTGYRYGIRHLYLGIGSRSLVASVLAYTVQAARFVAHYGNRYDVIVENFLPATPFFSQLLSRAPVILQIQGLWGLHHLRKFPAAVGLPMAFMERVYPRLYKRFLLVTQVNMPKAVVHAPRTAVIPNGIDRRFLNQPLREEPYILFMSRVDVHQKGLDVLVDAYSMIAGKYHLNLVIAGSFAPGEKERLLRCIPAGLESRVLLTGFLRGDRKLDVLSKAKIFVLPSRHEAHPISVLEAMGCGKPVVVSNIPELSYVTTNGLGLDFQVGDAQALARRMALLLEREDLRREFGRRGRLYASRFLWENIADRYEAFLRAVACEGPN